MENFVPSLQSYLIVLPAIFLAGVIDSIAGGGGLLSLPAYLAAGVPPHFALGTNKLSSCFGTLFATWRYHTHKMMELPVALTGGLSALLGSWAGTRTVLLLNPRFLNYLLAILVPVIALFTLMNKGLGGDDRSSELPRSRRLLLSCLGGGFFGFYDGCFGPGTGSFLLVFYILGLQYDLVKANGNTKVVNLASNIAALATFLLHGKVVLALGVPALFFGIGGNLLGARLVVSRGSRVIRPIFLLGLTLLMVKVLSNLWRS